MENCQMIDYRIVCPTRSRSLFFAILSSLFSAVCCQFWQFVPFVLCVGLSDDLLVYCQRCKGNPLQKKIKKKTEGGKRKGCRDHSSLVPKCGTNVLLFHCIDTTIAMATLRCPFHWLLVGASSSTASSHLIRIQFSPFSDFYEPINGTRGFLCDSLSPLIIVFYLFCCACFIACLFVCFVVHLTQFGNSLLLIIILFNPRPSLRARHLLVGFS